MKPIKFVILRSQSEAITEFGTLSKGRRGPVTVSRMGTPDRGAAALKVETAELTKDDIYDLNRDPTILTLAPAMPMKLHEPKDRQNVNSADLPSETWGIRAISAHESPYQGEGITVAVLDTGIDVNHEVFQGVTIVEKDFTGEGNGDSHGHGTHCAGTIVGQTVNGKRIGVALGIKKALIGKVLGAQGGSTESIVQAINWALDGGANVISMSLGMDFPGYVEDLISQDVPEDLATSIGLEGYRANVNLFSSLADVIEDRGAMLQATVVIAAAGNESRRDLDKDYVIAVAPPAAADGIYAVGALGQTAAGLEVAYFSNTKPNICGPGVDIQSAQAGGGYASMSGTSMATPHLAGITVLWAEKLLKTFGRIDPVALSAKVVASGTLEGLAPEFDALDIGTGLAQAPLD